MNTAYSMALAAALLHFVWEGALAALLLALFLNPPFGLLRNTSARVRYGAACLSLFAMAGAFALTLAVLWPSAQVGFEHHPIRWVTVPLISDLARNAMAARVDAHLWWLTPLWMLGACVFGLRSLASWFAAQRLRTTAICGAPEWWQERLRNLAAKIRVTRPVTLLESGLVQVPVVFGFLRPVILFPAGLLAGFPAEQVEYFLLHELAHVRRLDYVVNLLQTIVEDLLFYHPAVWWVSSVISAERENCCDDLAATRCNAHGLAAALAALEEHRSCDREFALAANGGSLANRIRRLLGQPESRRAGIAPAILAVALAASLAVAFGARGQQAPQPARQPKPAILERNLKEVHGPLIAQAQPNPQPVQQAAPVQQNNTAPNIPEAYRRWLDEEVVYIIQPEERAAFLRLGTEAELQQFIEEFWLRRDPTPGTTENEYRDEHYRRIQYTNQRFGFDGVSGWRTDRGQVYIKFGPPDEREEHPSGGTYDRPKEEGGGTTTVYPFEKWLYRYIQRVGTNVMIEFVDTARNGEYRWTLDPNRKVR